MSFPPLIVCLVGRGKGKGERGGGRADRPTSGRMDDWTGGRADQRTGSTCYLVFSPLLANRAALWWGIWYFLPSANSGWDLEKSTPI